jgi:uncharacterized protein YecE (DUF72 family)
MHAQGEGIAVRIPKNVAMADIWVGLSGWSYANWRGAFYPAALPSRDYLAFYAREFGTAEINSSFYHFLRPQTYERWAAQVPDDFVFAVKANRLLTHTRRLQEVEESWQRLAEAVLALGSHCGPILFQFPQSFRREERRLADFLRLARESAAGLRLVCEFRHASWFTEEIYRLLRRYGVALCLADSARYPRHDVLTTDFVYCRFHGRPELFASPYSEAELESLARQLQTYSNVGVDVYVYFNNTKEGHAIDNARMLLTLLGRQASPPVEPVRDRGKKWKGHHA